MKVLYIANNIPVPKQKSNRIILSIAEKLASYCDISFVFPAAIVFPPFSFMKKYKPLHGMKPWNDGNFIVRPVRYPRLPGKKLSYLLIDTMNPAHYVNKQFMPDLCHAHYIMPDGYIAYKVKQKYHIPYVVSVRSGDINHIKKLGGGHIIFKKFIKVLENAGAIIVHNRPQQEFIRNLGFESVLIPHGIESKILQINPNKENQTITISSVGEFTPTKQIDWVIQAVNEYTGGQKVQLIIVGSGKCKAQLEEIAHGKDNITFTGQIPWSEVMQILEQSHIFALPSSKETFGLVYLEAAAKKNAIIAYKGEGVDGVFEDEKEIILSSTYEDFKQQLYDLINDPVRREQMSDKAYEKVQNYTWEHISLRYVEIYRKVICR